MASRLLLSLLLSGNTQQPNSGFQELFSFFPTFFPPSAPSSVPPFPPENAIVDPVQINSGPFIIPNQNPGFDPKNRVPVSFEFQPSLQPPTQEPEPGKLYSVLMVSGHVPGKMTSFCFLEKVFVL